MKVFEAHITCRVSAYLNSLLKQVASSKKANQLLYEAFGIIDFFESDEELISLVSAISDQPTVVSEPDRAEYGDFQTNLDLANKVVELQLEKGVSPKIVIEPTCGKGSFIIASLRNLGEIKKIIGVEIYKPYVWECKFNIIDFYLQNQIGSKPDILIVHGSVFDFDFKSEANDKTLFQKKLNVFNKTYDFNVTLEAWQAFIDEMTPVKSGQMELFK